VIAGTIIALAGRCRQR